MHEPSSYKFALACGPAGVFVDVTDDVVVDSVTRQWGRGSEFDDARPGVFSFSLINGDGKYTPGNPLSTLATPLVEGMGVCWELNGQLRSGTIRSAQPDFINDPAAEGSPPVRSTLVRITCDDLLASASRRRLEQLEDALFSAAGGVAMWKLDDEAGSVAASEATTGRSSLVVIRTPVTFGSSVPAIPTGPVAAIGPSGWLWASNLPPWSYTAFPGAWNFWFMQAGGGEVMFNAAFVTDLEIINITVSLSSGNIRAGNFAVGVIGPEVEEGVGYFVSVTVTPSFVSGSFQFTYELWVDGVSYGTATYNPARDPTSLSNRYDRVELANLGLTGLVYYARLTHSNVRVDETHIYSSTASELLAAVAATSPEVVFDTLPDLSLAPLGYPDTEGRATLDVVNEIIRTEQGHVWAETTGTLTAPVQKVKVRERDRTETVTASFDITEVQYAPEFVRDISNMVALATAIGPDNAATWSDTDLTQYVGSASARDNVLLRDRVDLLAWAQDRIIRGKNVSVRVASFTVDALNLPTDRWNDLTTLVPGDRIRITGLPSEQLGFDTFDGWLLGGAEAHSYPQQMLFTFSLQPVLPPTAIYDHEDRRYMAGGVLSLDADIDASDTTMDIASADGVTKFTESGSDLPLVVVIGDEHIEVTACVSQVATVTRGVNGTTAASHAAGDLIELAVETLYAF